jgi:hypothetical protein
MMLTVNNHIFQTNSVVQGMNTSAGHQLHKTTVNLSCIQKGVIYYSIKIVNSLPPYILKLKQVKAKFRAALKEYHIALFFSFLDELLSFSQIIFSLQDQ